MSIQILMNPAYDTALPPIPLTYSIYEEKTQILPELVLNISNTDKPMTAAEASGYAHIRITENGTPTDYYIYFSIDDDWLKEDMDVLDPRKLSERIGNEISTYFDGDIYTLLRVWYFDPEDLGLDFKSTMVGLSAGRACKSCWGAGDK